MRRANEGAAQNEQCSFRQNHASSIIAPQALHNGNIPGSQLQRSCRSPGAGRSARSIVLEGGMNFPRRAGAWVACMRSRPGKFGRMGLTLPPMAAGLSACQESVLSPQGPIGKAERVILTDATIIMLAVVIPVILLTAAFAWWFRAGNGRASYLPDWEYSGRIEMIVWSIPALVITSPSSAAWRGSAHISSILPTQSFRRKSRSTWRLCRSIGNGCSSIPLKGLQALRLCLMSPSGRPVRQAPS